MQELLYSIIYLEDIKKLANNRFMTVSNYDLKLYALNKNNCYEVILFYHDASTKIYEIDGENYLIIDSIVKTVHKIYNCETPEENYTEKRM